MLDIFYEEIIQEASRGKVECFSTYNIFFDTKLVEEGIEIRGDKNYDGTLKPTLIIKNKKEFDALLIEYLVKALEFYDDSNFFQEVLEHQEGSSKEKLILTLLWSNATYEDFNNPVEFLRKRIAFLDDNTLNDFKETKVLGYSEILKGNMEVTLMEAHLVNETPYCLRLIVRNEDVDDEKYCFPNIYLGIADNKAYVYAIQSDEVSEDKYAKKVNRALFKIGTGLDVVSESDEEYGIGNLKDVTASFVVAANVALSLLKEKGIQEIIVPSILLPRWNGKEISFERKEEFLRKRTTEEEAKKLTDVNRSNHIDLQRNLTEKYIRTFLRLCHHHSGIDVFSYPFEQDSAMHLRLQENNYCNNPLLEETFQLAQTAPAKIKK